jgi:hypothetical protein
VDLANTCHSCTFLAGLNLPGADLNSEGWPEGQNTWMYSVIQRPGTKRHWIPASAGMTLSGVFAGSMKIFIHSIWRRVNKIIVSQPVANVM